MKPEDQKALLSAWAKTNHHNGDHDWVTYMLGWQSALAHRDAQPAVAVDHSGLIKRIDAAIERVTQGRGLMSIPANPRSDVDLVLCECKALLQGENPPFWARNFHPAVAVNEQLLEALKLADAALEGAHMNADVVYKKVKAAIAATEAAKKGGAG